jgi:hypothetical protein
MDWKAVGTFGVAVLGGFAVLIGIVNSLVTLTAGERLRRRLSAHLDILNKLPAQDGKDATTMSLIVSGEVERLRQITLADRNPALAKVRFITRISQLGNIAITVAGITLIVATDITVPILCVAVLAANIVNAWIHKKLIGRAMPGILET